MSAYEALSLSRRFPAPNYVNPETRSWAASACLIAICVLTTLVFTARIWARFRITHTPGWDDWLIIASMPLLLGQTIVTVLALRVYGFQHHIYDLKPRDFITIRQVRDFPRLCQCIT
ncbi:hypothetical protein DM02DRAFT_517763 [Periconia macrospinosa]|uniref:Rhodopsin domain-containing protein n=1 Tax=Periconia macrospinosa TaxID=97972 RepID=A0A2V1E3N7_9PLEO|nr:hypothetical protein DM02DRAFT_517763 [Periconia macrospinosa]